MGSRENSIIFTIIFDSYVCIHSFRFMCGRFNSDTLWNAPIIEIVGVERVVGVVGDPSYNRHFAIRAKIELHSTLRNYNAHAYYASHIHDIRPFCVYRENGV